MKSGRFLSLTILCVLLTVCKLFAQTIKNYEKEWKHIDELINQKNLPKSALEEVRKIYALAKKEKQEAQIIKSLVYTIRLQQEIREENEAQAINDIEKEIAENKEPAVSILKSLEAGLYWQYYQQHRWQLYNRTNTLNFNKEDLATWTAEDFHKKISELFGQSIQKKEVLKQTDLKLFDALIIKGNVRYLRPTLFDLLAHQALEYFKNDERDIKRPSYAFEISQPEAFAPAATFARYPFVTKDSLSLQLKALLIYQDLISFHLNDTSPAALMDVDLERIQFVHQVSVAENKEALYKAALENCTQQYGSSPVAAQALYLLAAFYENRATQYDPLKDTSYRFDRVKAKEILERVVKDSSRFGTAITGREGWTNSYNLLNQINRPAFSFEVEKVNLPAQPFRALVKYKNVGSLHFRLIKVERTESKPAINFYDDKYWDTLLIANPVRQWQQTLPATNDWQEHAVEIKIEALPLGEYILLASSNKEFVKKKSNLGAQLFYVSNISYINLGNRFFVLHRESGQPLANAAVQVYTQQYDYKAYRYDKVKMGSYQTDKNGFFRVENQKDNNRSNNLYLDISYGTDRLNLNDPIYDYYPFGSMENEEEKTIQRTFFFTDRSIYRPGQTVYFKGIVIATNKKENNIVTAFTTTLFLKNANGENVDSLKLTTNEFGSFSGKFTLPQNVLNGEFQIQDELNNSVGFSVEEYKRPKFFVDWDKVKQSYKVNDSITITGNAKAYAGNTISGAKVVYRIVRQPRLIYPWLFKGWWPPAEPMEIAHGETVTNFDGQFFITFKAIPDLKLDKKLDPVFNYLVYADVTDINGETRSGENTVTAGYKSILIKTEVAERMAIDSLKNIFVRTENMNGEFQPSTITVTITKLIPENRLLRKRYWQQPDQFVMNRQDFISSFPHDEYRNESDYHNWVKGDKVAERTDSTKVSGEWPVENNKLSAGFYVLEIKAKDKEGSEVKDVHYFELLDVNKSQLNRPEYIWWNRDDFSIEPGQKATVQIGSSAQNIFLIQQQDQNPVFRESHLPAVGEYSFSKLDNEKKNFDFPATEASRGGYGVSFFFVKDNRFYQSTHIINVPWTNKELTIQYATFRDKTLPGSEEKWKVKISGYRKDAVAAEMLAGMYDASLDQFRIHSWYKPGIWPVYARTFEWTGSQNFSATPSQMKWAGTGVYKQFRKQYDYLNFNLQPGPSIRIRGVSNKPQARMGEEIKETVITASAAPNAPGIRRKEELAQDSGDNSLNQESIIVGYGTKKEAPQIIQNIPKVQPRKNFNETAFFFPDLRTDKDGAIEFSFTMPEALTSWKLQTLAHTKDLAFGLSQKEIVTQKQLMVQPNMPRFLREGDRMELSVKVVNLSSKDLLGKAELQLLDATTNQPVDGRFKNIFPKQNFTVAAGKSDVVRFPVEVPYQFNNALVWRIVARSENYSDGEEAALPVLTNKTLVTETMPLPLRGSGTRNFTFEKLLNAGKSNTLQQHAVTIEYTANPAWYAVQALPYLSATTYECADQIWNRYYANSLASFITSSAPRIRQVFEQWKSTDTPALLSNLQKNQELKQVLLEETPWVLEAKTEAQQKKNIALLFDLARMSSELKSNLEQLKQYQSENGGFVWFKGGPDDRYMTQYIVTGIGHLKKLRGATYQQDEVNSLVQAALPYLDKKIKEDYDNLIKYKADLSKPNTGYTQIQYLYMRSFFPEYPVPQAMQTAYTYFRRQAQQFWMKQNKYMQGMTALMLYRTGDGKTPKDILSSLKETAIINEETGMYWKENNFGISWFWWQAPIETQSLLTEAFTEIGNNTQTVDDLKTWLLKNKQTNNWPTTKATAEACYALLLQGTDWLSNEPAVTIKLGTTIISGKEVTTQQGTGYFKKTVEGSLVRPEMGNISVTVQPANSSNHQPVQSPSWGAVYWQYFEELDKIAAAATPLQLSKKLFVEKNTDRGPVLSPVNEGTVLQVGDKIKVRIEMRADRDMEYVHMKDMRASALEPVNVLSGYQWQGGLGYYQTTKDAGTNFFFSFLRKGTYVFEYPLFVSHAGNFSNGITTIQCMYAPEFSAHSEGVRINVKK
jgi:hypothetical protein